MASKDIEQQTVDEPQWRPSPASLTALIGKEVAFTRDVGQTVATSIGMLGEFDDETKSELLHSRQSTPFNITSHSSFPLNAA